MIFLTLSRKITKKFVKEIFKMNEVEKYEIDCIGVEAYFVYNCAINISIFNRMFYNKIKLIITG